jgi:hypothetical protein
MTNLLKNKFSSFMIVGLLISLSTFSNELKVISDSIPYEVELMFDHINESKLSQKENELFIADLDLLNDDLSSLDKRNLLFLFKSEIYKGIFTNQYLKSDTKLQLSSSVINAIKKKIDKNKVVYTKYSLWTIESILNDLTPFMEDNFINRYQNINRGNSKDVLKAKKLKKIFKYVSPFLAAFLNKSPELFNLLQKNIILDTFSRIALKSFYYQTHYIKGAKADNNLFSLPKAILKVPVVKVDKGEMTLKAKSMINKKEAKKLIDSIEKDEMSGASQSIDQSIKELEQRNPN